MNLVDWIGALLGILGVILTIYQKIACWPVSIVSVMVSSYSFYHAGLFGDSALQILYLFQSVYGWLIWKKNEELKHTVAYHIPKNKTFFFTYFTFGQAIAYYFILVNLNSTVALADALLTAASVTATYMMSKKWIESWILWILIDLSYIILYLEKDLTPYAIQYFIFTLLALNGFLQWRKVLPQS